MIDSTEKEILFFFATGGDGGPVEMTSISISESSSGVMLIDLKNGAAIAASCNCSLWYMTASKSRSAKALRLRIRSLICTGGGSGEASDGDEVTEDESLDPPLLLL